MMKNISQKNLIYKIEKFFFTNGWDPLPFQIESWNAFLKGENGKEKLEPPYVLLVDINMPRMDGLEFIEHLRQDEQLKQSVVFILSTSKNEEDKHKAYELNVAGYIYKETAGSDFLNLVDLMKMYWRIVELPKIRQ